MSTTQFRVIDQPIYFSDASAAQAYAKNNPGATITRISSNNQVSMQHNPKSILQHLNKSIIAQDEAKREVATTMYYHALKTKYKDAKNIQSSGPIMLIGPTGSGKTFVVQQACELMDTLFVHVDTSSMVSEGIVGYNIGKLAADILKKADFNQEKAESCVVFFDEMDKLFHPDSDEYGSEVSHQLLRFTEGTIVHIPKQDLGKEEDYTLSTNKMQFILGGAFQWILDKKDEASSKEGMGFLNNSTDEIENDFKKITLDDLYENDVPKELLGRMHTIVNLYALTKRDYHRILTQSEKSPLKEFIAKVEFHGDLVQISDDIIESIADYASKSELGVRSIRQVLKQLFAEALFEAPNPTQKTHEIVWNIQEEK
ncbi:AAA family ATPase [Sulfurimonas sp.]